MTPQRRTMEIHDLVNGLMRLMPPSKVASEALAGAVQAAMMEGRGTDYDASGSAQTADVTGSGHSGSDARIAELDAELEASIAVFETTCNQHETKPRPRSRDER